MFSGRHSVEAPRLFSDRYMVTNPWVVKRKNLPPKDFKFESNIEEGDFYRVIPNTARDVLFLQMLGKNVDVFLPREGEGLLVRCSAVDPL